ncbi:MmgE/PrpD family protein [Chloroflexota bacterium]
MDIGYNLAKYIYRTTYRDLPEEVIVATKKSILDVLGVTIAAVNEPGCVEVANLVQEWGGKEESTVIGYGYKVPAHNAVFVNGVMGRALDFDDIYAPCPSHVSIEVVPPALAIAEKVGGISGKDFITATAIGQDICCRFGKAIDVPCGLSGISMTFHAGTFAAAVVAAKILGFNEEKIIQTLGIAYSLISGNMQGTIEGSLLVRVQSGVSAQAGVLAAILAERGITGTVETLEGKFGYFPIYQQGKYRREDLINDLGNKFEGVNLSFKQYPCCKATHMPIQGTLDLLKEYNIKQDMIKEIKVATNTWVHNVVCQPLEFKRIPRNLIDAQFSIPYTLAVAVTNQSVKLSDFNAEAIKRKNVLDIAQKIVPIIDGNIEHTHPHGFNVVIEIETKDGRNYSKAVNSLKGDPDNSLTWEEVTNKFNACLTYNRGHFDAEKLIQIIGNLENIEDVRSIFDYLKS